MRAFSKITVMASLVVSSLVAGCSPASSAPAGSAGTATISATPASEVSSSIPSSSLSSSAAAAFGGLERKYDARLGLWVLDTGTGRSVQYRAGERFAHASTFKAMAAGVLLK